MTRVDLFETISARLGDERSGVLATIASVRGSSPAPELSRLYVPPLGETLGTVGGGCLEAEVMREAKKLRAAGGWRRIAFSLTEADEELRMVCGGTVEILLEVVGSNDQQLFELLARRRRAGQSSLLLRRFTGGGPSPLGSAAAAATLRSLASGTAAPKRMLLGEEGECLVGDGEFAPPITRRAIRALHAERAEWSADGEFHLEPIVGLAHLVLIGAGHVSRAVYAAARRVGFRVTVIDDRAKYVAAERFPEAERIVIPSYRGVAERVAIAPHDFIVLATRGHQFDEEVLEQLLGLAPTRYLGVIGSRRKHALAERNLTARGIPAERFRALSAPIGLDIGAVTPDEIAVAIVAEMIAVKRRARAGAELPLCTPPRAPGD